MNVKAELKAVELKVRTEIAGAVHEAGEVVEVVKHWAEWLIENKHAAPARKGAASDSGTAGTAGKQEG